MIENAFFSLGSILQYRTRENPPEMEFGAGRRCRLAARLDIGRLRCGFRRNLCASSVSDYARYADKLQGPPSFLPLGGRRYADP